MIYSQRRILSLCFGVGVAVTVLSSPLAAQGTGGSPLDSLSPAKREALDTAFKNGNDALAQKKYAEAVTEYKKVLAVIPDETSTLWNCGMASFSAKDYVTSLQCWKRLRPLVPQSPQEDASFTVAKVSAKLIQVYQAIGNKAARAQERAALVQLRRSKIDPALAQQSAFCCDQFVVEGKNVFAYDYFALTGKLSIRYDFVVTKPDGTMDYHIALECNPDDNALAHELHEIKPNERMFSLDGFYNGGRTHRTFGFLQASAPKLPTDRTAVNPAPEYDTVKKIVIAVLQGKVRSITSSTSGKP